jgi:hypothetical protein
MAKMVNLSAIAFTLGMTDEELMQNLDITPSAQIEKEAVMVLRRYICSQADARFRKFAQAMGSFVEEI